MTSTVCRAIAAYSGEPADRHVVPPPFTSQALRHRGADYFEQTRTPRAEWKTLDDVAPTLNEYELRYLGEDYDVAARAMQVVWSYLASWGHYRLVAEMLERLQGRITDPWLNASCVNVLGGCYRTLGQYRRAIACHEQSLDAVHQLGDRRDESVVLSSLGSCYWPLGQIDQAAELYGQALLLAREFGSAGPESTALCGLGLCHEYAGELTQAIDRHQEALAIVRDLGDRNKEAVILHNLASYRRDLGQLPEAVQLYAQALAITREVVARGTESACLSSLADALADRGAWGLAAENARNAIEIADAIGYAQAQNAAWLSLARTMLLSGDLPSALAAALAAGDHLGFLLSASRVSLVLGVCRLRLDQPAAAARDFRDTITRADELITQSPSLYAQHDSRALALCGLALIEDPALTGQAAAAFSTARGITSGAGIVGHVLGLFDVLATADDGGVLAAVRPAAAGEE